MMKVYHGKVAHVRFEKYRFSGMHYPRGPPGTEKSRAKWGTAGVIKLVETSPLEDFFNRLVPEQIQIHSLRLHLPTSLILLPLRTRTTTRNSCNLSNREP